MTDERLLVVPKHWVSFFEATGIPAAVRVGRELIVGGHTGEALGLFAPDASEQLRQTLQNITETLAEAATEWADVVEICSYHVGLRAQAADIVSIAEEFMSRPLPPWTAVGVTELYEHEALVEVSCRAIVETWPEPRRVGGADPGPRR